MPSGPTDGNTSVSAGSLDTSASGTRRPLDIAQSLRELSDQQHRQYEDIRSQLRSLALAISTLGETSKMRPKPPCVSPSDEPVEWNSDEVPVACFTLSKEEADSAQDDDEILGNAPEKPSPSFCASEMSAADSPPRREGRLTTWSSSDYLKPPEEEEGGVSSRLTRSRANTKNLDSVMSNVKYLEKKIMQGFSARASSQEFVDWRADPLKFCRRCAIRVVEQPFFDIVIGAIIFANTLTIGMEISLRARGEHSQAIEFVEHMFLGAYVIELIIRFFAYGKACFSKPWIVFDMVLVGTSCLFSWILVPALGDATSFSARARGFMLIRVVRLVRLIRALRVLSMFKVLWKLVLGLACAADTIFATFVLILIAVYIWACIAVEVLTMNDDIRQVSELDKLITQFFPTLPTSMLTLLQFVTLDSVGSIYHPLIDYEWRLVFFFGPLMLVLPVTIMNLVTAVLVDGALTRSQADRDLQEREIRSKCKALIPQFHEAFSKIDKNGSGTITRSEAQSCHSAMPSILMQRLGSDKLVEIFDILDVDGSGEIDENEFIEGIILLVVSHVNIETLQILKLSRLSWMRISKVEERLRHLHRKFREFGMPPDVKFKAGSSYLSIAGPQRENSAAQVMSKARTCGSSASTIGCYPSVGVKASNACLGKTIASNASLRKTIDMSQAQPDEEDLEDDRTACV